MKQHTLAIVVSLAALTAPGLATAQTFDLSSEGLPSATGGGQFPAMVSPDPIVGQYIQDAWTDAQQGAGVKKQQYDPNDTVRVQLRSGMISTIVLPSGEAIADRALGDKVNFGVKEITGQPNKIWVWVRNPGFDTNLNIIGGTGSVYTFYLRGETPDTNNITQQVIRLDGGAPSVSDLEPDTTTSTGHAPNAMQQKAVAELGANMPDLPPDYLRKGCIFDPTKIRTDRVMKGDADIAPVQVFRDDCFTYLDFGKNADAKTWPGVWQLNDQVDEPVSFDASRDGRFMIVHTTKPLTLKDGKKLVCVRIPKGV